MAKDRRQEFVYPLREKMRKGNFPYTPENDEPSSVVCPVRGKVRHECIAVGATLNDEKIWIYAFAPKTWNKIARILQRECGGIQLPSGYISEIDATEHGQKTYAEHRIPRVNFNEIPFSVILEDMAAYKNVVERIIHITDNDHVIDYANIQKSVDVDYFAEEGTLYVAERVERQRSTRLREAARGLLNDYVCSACGFDFEKSYGPLGRGFIELHHVRQLGEMGREGQKVRTTDLVPLCSNCHRMIHRCSSTLSVEDLRRRIQNIKAGG